MGLEFSVKACAHGASIGHRLVKVFEKDATTFYDTEFNTMQKDFGSKIGQRMNTSISRWAVGK